MAQAWDWRQSYVEYSAPPEGQDLQLPTPQGPEAPAPGCAQAAPSMVFNWYYYQRA